MICMNYSMAQRLVAAVEPELCMICTTASSLLQGLKMRLRAL